MKRSEMVAKLIQTVGTYDSWRDQCSYMLFILEEAGMLPPQTGRGFNFVNIWDNEDLDMTNVTRAEVPGTGKTMDELRRGEEE